MQFRFFSDLHMERDLEHKKRPVLADLWQPPRLSSDLNTVLILPGDIWTGVRPLHYSNWNLDWISNLALRFKAVVLVLGNHDYWTEHLTALPAKWRHMLQKKELTNVHLLEIADGIQQGTVVIDGVRILGGTLWTSMNRANPLVCHKFDHEIGFDGRPVYNDRNYIRAGGFQKFNSLHWLRRHNKSIAQLREALTVGQEPVLLVSHHAPCLLSARAGYGEDLSTYLYASDLSDLILDHPRIKQALHGHTHMPLDYPMGNVRIRCNPRGYAPTDLVDGFDTESFCEI